MLLSRLRCIGSRGLPYLPSPPAERVFSFGNSAIGQVSLSNEKWAACMLSLVAGIYCGTHFGQEVLTRKNPPNPLKNPFEQPPLVHPHAEEDDD